MMLNFTAKFSSIIRAKSLFIHLALTMFVLGCVTSLEKSITIHPGAQKDKDYYTTYERFTNSYEATDNFKTKYTLTSTYLNKEFLRAFATRHEHIYNEPEPSLQEVSDKLGFFISLYTANKKMDCLDDSKLWSIKLKSGDKSLKPVQIKKLSQKARWTPFFPAVNNWTSEYLVLFEKTALSSNENFVQPYDTALIVSSSAATIKIPL